MIYAQKDTYGLAQAISRHTLLDHSHQQHGSTIQQIKHNATAAVPGGARIIVNPQQWLSHPHSSDVPHVPTAVNSSTGNSMQWVHGQTKASKFPVAFPTHACNSPDESVSHT
eukprot:6565351-Pyramimonas_sp.AAC.1